MQAALAKIQGEHLEVTVADLRQQLIAATAAAEQAAAQVAAKDASLDEVSACLTKVRQDAQQAKQTADANLQGQQAAVLQRDWQLVELQSRLDTAVQEAQASKRTLHSVANKALRFCPRCATPVPAAPVERKHERPRPFLHCLLSAKVQYCKLPLVLPDKNSCTMRADFMNFGPFPKKPKRS